MDRSFPWTTTGMVLLASRQIGIKAHRTGRSRTGPAEAARFTTFDNQKVVAALIPWVHADPTPLRTSNLRAPGDLARTFASESFIDEIASELGVDPVQFRLRYLSDNKRADRGACCAATKQAGVERAALASARLRPDRRLAGEAWRWPTARTPSPLRWPKSRWTRPPER